jgi:site-specific DNA-methyltransferase (adenine-specific)
MKKLNNNSIDLLFCDLPYGVTGCKWDCLIDLSQFWKEVNRICKDTTPMFFTCSTRFGVSLIQSNPKNFRYDMVWVKSAPCGFLNAKKMPMRKHEMVYVFYRKLPFYDISSHKHKFLKDPSERSDTTNQEYEHNGNDPLKDLHSQYEPSLPNNILKETEEPNTPQEIFLSEHNTAYGNNIHFHQPEQRNGESIYNPPLPNSILEIKSERGKHATQKPVALIEWCLKYYSKEGDMVLDPTAGSGTTGVACKKMNRKFIGIEKDHTIYQCMVERNK